MLILALPSKSNTSNNEMKIKVLIPWLSFQQLDMETIVIVIGILDI